MINNDKVIDKQDSEKLIELRDQIKKDTDIFNSVYQTALLDGNNQRKFGYGMVWNAEDLYTLDKNEMPKMGQNELDRMLKSLVSEIFNSGISLKITTLQDDLDSKLLEGLTSIIHDILTRSNHIKSTELLVDDTARTGLFSAVLIQSEYKNEYNFDQELTLHPIHFDRIFFDVNAQDQTKCDGRFVGYYDLVSREQFEKEYPDHSLAFYTGGGTEPMFYMDLGSSQDKRVLLIHYFDYIYEDTRTIYFTNFKRTVMNTDELQIGESILSERKVSTKKVRETIATQKDILEIKHYEISQFPLVFMSGYQTIMNNKMYPRSYGYEAHGIQKMLNITTSKLGQQILNANTTQLIFKKGQITGSMETALKNPLTVYPYLEVENEYPMHNPGIPIDPSILNLYMLLPKEIERILGRTDAVAGRANPAQSGISQQLQVSQSNIITFFYYRNAIDTMRQIGRVLAEWIPKVYTYPFAMNTSGKNFRFNSGKENAIHLEDLKPNMGYNIEILPSPNFEIQRQEALKSLTDILKIVPPELAQTLLPEIIDSLKLENNAEVKHKVKEYYEINDPITYGLMTGEEPKKLIEMKAQQAQQPNINEETMKLQSALLQLEKQNLQIKEERMSLAAQKNQIELNEDLAKRKIDLANIQLKQKELELKEIKLVMDKLKQETNHAHEIRKELLKKTPTK